MIYGYQQRSPRHGYFDGIIEEVSLIIVHFKDDTHYIAGNRNAVQNIGRLHVLGSTTSLQTNRS